MAYRKRVHPKTLLELADRFPPVLCRLLARKGRRPMTHREIAAKSGLSLDRISRWSHATSWEGMRLGDIQKFALACGVNHVRYAALSDYIRRRKMPHLFRKGLNPEQRRMINELLSVSGK